MDTRRWLNRKNLIILLSVLGPGIIVNMVDTDAGGIATYSVAGARYGYAVAWVLLPTAILLFMVQEMNARLGIVTGKGLAALIRERFSLRLTALVMLALVVANFSNAVSDFAGIAASMELFHIGRYVSVPLLALGIWWMVIKWPYRKVEKIFLIISLVYISYIISAFMAKPEWGEVARGLFVPSARADFPYIAMVITIVGTTIAPWMQFYQQAAIVDKGLDTSSLTYERIDTGVGTFFAVIVGLFIVICCGAAFFNKPGVGATQIESAEQAAVALAPVAGKYASYLFATGLLFASVFAASILPLTTAYTICEAFGWESGLDRSFSEAPKFYLIYTFFIVGGALLVMIPRFPLIKVMVISQTINGILLPVIITCMLIIINDRDIMGNYVNRGLVNKVIWMGAIILYILDLWLVISSIVPIGH
jgi:NRAMP (natural resistance-associated macrophage protein)-like metal ion transporter